MVGLSFLPAGKRPSFDHSNKVVLLKGRNSKMSLALPKPCVGSCIAGLFTVVASVSCEVLSVKGITEVFWVGCVISTAPYRMICTAAECCDMDSLGCIKRGRIDVKVMLLLPP